MWRSNVSRAFFSHLQLAASDPRRDQGSAVQTFLNSDHHLYLVQDIETTPAQMQKSNGFHWTSPDVPSDKHLIQFLSLEPVFKSRYFSSPAKKRASSEELTLFSWYRVIFDCRQTNCQSPERMNRLIRFCIVLFCTVLETVQPFISKK